MKAGMYKCEHCGNIVFRDKKGRNPNGALMGLRCEACQFDTLYHRDWWFKDEGVVTAPGPEYWAELRKEFEEAEKRLLDKKEE